MHRGVLTSSSHAHFFLKETLILDFRLKKRNSLLGLPRALQKLRSQSQKVGKCIHSVSLSPAVYFPQGSCEEKHLNKEMGPILLHFTVQLVSL